MCIVRQEAFVVCAPIDCLLRHVESWRAIMVGANFSKFAHHTKSSNHRPFVSVCYCWCCSTIRRYLHTSKRRTMLFNHIHALMFEQLIHSISNSYALSLDTIRIVFVHSSFTELAQKVCVIFSLSLSLSSSRIAVFKWIVAWCIEVYFESFLMFFEWITCHWFFVRSLSLPLSLSTFFRLHAKKKHKTFYVLHFNTHRPDMYSESSTLCMSKINHISKQQSEWMSIWFVNYRKSTTLTPPGRSVLVFFWFSVLCVCVCRLVFYSNADRISCDCLMTLFREEGKKTSFNVKQFF